MISTVAHLDTSTGTLHDPPRETQSTDLVPTSLPLAKGATTAIRLRSDKEIHIQGKAGLLWVTMEGDAHDYLISHEDSVCFPGPGLLVLEGMTAQNEVEWHVHSKY